MSLSAIAAAIVRNAGASSEVLAWFSRGLPRAGQPFERGVFFGFYAGAGRRLRSLARALSPDEYAALCAEGVLSPEHWSLADLARAALLLQACETLPMQEHAGLVHEAFRKGDADEQCAVLRVLAYLPQPERFVQTALEATRSHVVPVFTALACENPFPVCHLPELHLNQLVMKAFFLDLAVTRIQGLAARRNAELARMASDFYAERKAAGRPVPADLGFVNPMLAGVP